ncbi:MAG TPA: hypothetical protein PKI32_02375 [Opitutales bacterium]|nr:hypothetical protein [Opitutales bacterium]
MKARLNAVAILVVLFSGAIFAGELGPVLTNVGTREKAGLKGDSYERF